MTETAPRIAVVDAGAAPSSLTAVLCRSMGEALRGQGASALMLEAQGGASCPTGREPPTAPRRCGTCSPGPTA